MPSPQTKRLKATVGAQRTTEDRWKEENSSIADNEDADAPRVSQWVDEDDLNDEEDEAESFGPPGNTLTSLENGLPYSTNLLWI
ncbi:hypothetical protein GYMLUDRAFT_303097 [Collybiopsis luxurians FD-317 M1]|nr:hypothetical protein GYMLUDRAFT_303097 [Collybiopsis luxurians FD-317 M1]